MKSDIRQLDLFEREERSAIIEHEAGTSRMYADHLAGVGYLWRGPIPYLIDCISDGETLIHLFGENPHTCLIRILESYEPENAKKRAWVSRKDARKLLKKNGYAHHCKLITPINGVEAIGEVWRKP